ncbi:MAG TPA: endonuclease/exonuclease/phosphatase family protein, partial [Candidatus Sericytochromatia bacterium]
MAALALLGWGYLFYILAIAFYLNLIISLMKIATWNVNSIRSRLTHVVDWLQETNVDVLCLQETKVVDEDFPRSPFE